MLAFTNSDEKQSPTIIGAGCQLDGNILFKFMVLSTVIFLPPLWSLVGGEMLKEIFMHKRCFCMVHFKVTHT